MKPRRPRRAPSKRFRFGFNLRKAMFVLPNLFTCASILCGFFAILLVSGTPGPTQFYQATLAIFFGIFFDMADGRVARLTRTQSDFGVQLDSLADVVSFGVAPAVIVYHWGLSHMRVVGVLAAFTYLACGAIRLARFNVIAARAGGGSNKWFMGLPIPLAAGVLISLVMFHQRTYAAPTTRQQHIIALILVLSYLMISNVRYRTFKQVRVSKKSFAAFLATLATFTGLALAFQPPFALFVFFSGYVAVGLLEAVWFIGRRRDEPKRSAASTSQAPESGLTPPSAPTPNSPKEP